MSSLTITLAPELEQALDEIATRAQQTRETVASEALAAFIREDAEAWAAIRGGQDDARAGRTTPHDVALQRLRKAAGAA